MKDERHTGSRYSLLSEQHEKDIRQWEDAYTQIRREYEKQQGLHGFDRIFTMSSTHLLRHSQTDAHISREDRLNHPHPAPPMTPLNSRAPRARRSKSLLKPWI